MLVHDLRSPLHSMMTYMQVLSGRDAVAWQISREERRQFEDSALDSAQHMLGVINGFLDLIVPTHGGSVGGASVEFIDASAQSIFADMRSNGVVGS